jgi:hypothetical protein
MGSVERNLWTWGIVGREKGDILATSLMQGVPPNKYYVFGNHYIVENLVIGIHAEFCHCSRFGKPHIVAGI